MRYFCYHEPIDDGSAGGVVMTVTDDWIRENYYPRWYELMCNKFGKEKVDSTYCFLDCLDDWIAIHWAWESSE